MKNRFIALLDSGVGGLSVFKELIKYMPNEKYLYFGDNENIPYGDKNTDELIALTRKNIEEISRYGIKALVVGCNTLSVSVLGVIAPTLPFPVFGVYPRVNKGSGNTLLFCTPTTAKNLKATEDGANVRIIPLKDLASDVEKNKFSLERIDIERHFSGNNELDKALKEFDGKVDTVFLGCTHYGFLAERFYDRFSPKNILSGDRLTAKRTFFCLNKNGLLSKSKDFSIDFIGRSAEENLKFYEKIVKQSVNFTKKMQKNPKIF